MGTRTVRLDDETEKVLREIQTATDMPISTALKKGLRAVRDEIVRTGRRSAWDVYAELDLGPGGYAKGPSTSTRATARRLILERSSRR
jgi:hypothetical protein